MLRSLYWQESVCGFSVNPCIQFGISSFPSRLSLSSREENSRLGGGGGRWVGREEMTAQRYGSEPGGLTASSCCPLPPSRLGSQRPLSPCHVRMLLCNPTNLQGLGFLLLLSAVSFTVPPTAFCFLSPFSEVISNHSLDLFLASVSF